MEMYNHYEDEENHEMEKTQLQEKPFQYPPGNKLMKSPEEENIQQDFQFPNRKNFKEEQENKVKLLKCHNQVSCLLN